MNKKIPAASVSILFLLAACNAPQGDLSIEPAVAQQRYDARHNPDKALADRVKKALETDSQLASQGIEVTATNGTVQLWGLVDSTRARQRVERTAAGVVGVRGVDSRLKLDPGA